MKKLQIGWDLLYKRLNNILGTCALDSASSVRYMTRVSDLLSFSRMKSILILSLISLMFHSTGCFAPFSTEAKKPKTPDAPAQPMAAVVVNHKVNLSWQLPVSAYDGFYIYRQQNNQAFKLIAETGKVNSFVDTSVVPDGYYRYYSQTYCKACSTQLSVNSNIVQIHVP